MTYAAQVQITANTAWKTWYTASTHATEATEAVIAWYLDTFFSEKASVRYEEIGKILGFAMVCAVACGMTARIIVQHWIDDQVTAAMVETSVAPLTSPLPPLTQRLEALKGPQLRRLCVVKGIEYRNFNGPKKNMKVAQMREALVTALMDQ